MALARGPWALVVGRLVVGLWSLVVSLWPLFFLPLVLGPLYLVVARWSLVFFLCYVAFRPLVFWSLGRLPFGRLVFGLWSVGRVFLVVGSRRLVFGLLLCGPWSFCLWPLVVGP